jgi:mRNA interferase MazF
VKRGDIRWYRFRPPDKRRPVLVLTRNSVIVYLNEVTVAPITSTVREIPSEVRLDEDDGMPGPCAVNVDHLQTVSKDRVGSLITALSSEKLAEVKNAVRFALDL